MKCLLCKTGNVVLSGSFEYCDNCRYCRFVVTDDYIDACTKVLAVLMSNTNFNDSEAAAYFVNEHIKNHLPKLFDFLTSLENGMQQLTDEIIKLTFDQAVNLQIGGKIVGESEEPDDLVCQCGCTVFKPIDNFKTMCMGCGALYKSSSETNGRYEPEFLCECGYAAYETEEGTNLVHCKGCGQPFLHIMPADYFERVGED